MRARKLMECYRACQLKSLATTDEYQGMLLASYSRSMSVERGRTSHVKPVRAQGNRVMSSCFAALYSAVPTIQKTRIHFHRFFDELHRNIRDHRTEREAVDRAIDEVTGAGRLLFFDELHVHDSGDARLLTRLLENAFRRGITVLATSNYAPKDLLPNPVWHNIFEPGIELIETNMQLFHLEGPTDYRSLRVDHAVGFAAGTWTTRTPVALPTHSEATTAEVRGRHFSVLATRPAHLWVSFSQICDSPTSTIEYLEWTRAFTTWTITDVPLLREADLEAQQRFINLVDVLVDVDVDVCVHFVSTHELATFLEGATQRPDAFRLASRMQLLRQDPA